ncbi:uncharacterized protein MONBRDRAFT_32288 [Monosiga brevicollis MX1]|uniref:BZIP domain-containing protein n=1 Tax=Monosiga brevicollis TaxID=81824 RepID=A9UYK3_MONBE|nr:uncharacterized protein MONBRDRAFT_32288 [Monosiga brevicollis MX1]EDQ89477.1 predicted protein [Monosiga brevicollis MX1]|eukprot:XP_001745506.1 hypothetical protein [Monosiga brevicollis MX1]
MSATLSRPNLPTSAAPGFLFHGGTAPTASSSAFARALEAAAPGGSIVSLQAINNAIMGPSVRGKPIIGTEVTPNLDPMGLSGALDTEAPAPLDLLSTVALSTAPRAPSSPSQHRSIHSHNDASRNFGTSAPATEASLGANGVDWAANTLPWQVPWWSSLLLNPAAAAAMGMPAAQNSISTAPALSTVPGMISTTTSTPSGVGASTSSAWPQGLLNFPAVSDPASLQAVAMAAALSAQNAAGAGNPLLANYNLSSTTGTSIAPSSSTGLVMPSARPGAVVEASMAPTLLDLGTKAASFGHTQNFVLHRGHSDGGRSLQSGPRISSTSIPSHGAHSAGSGDGDLDGEAAPSTKRARRRRIADLAEADRARLRRLNREAARKHRERSKWRDESAAQDLQRLVLHHKQLASEAAALRTEVSTLREVVRTLYLGTATRAPERSLRQINSSSSKATSDSQAS